MDQNAQHRISQRLAELRKTSETELGWVKTMLKKAHSYTETIMETVRVPFVVLDADLRVLSANRAFYQTFKIPPVETEGRPIYELDNSQWDNPRLRILLEERLPTDTQITDFEMDYEFPEVGRRTMLINAHRYDRSENVRPVILLALEDITERRQVEETRQHLADVHASKDHLEREVTRLREAEETHLQTREAAGRQIDQLNTNLQASEEELERETLRRQEAEGNIHALEELIDTTVQAIQDKLVAVGQAAACGVDGAHED
ncbi:MAG: PAS domain-containing protein, partial [Candidatus Tectimicrobiota bacterium]